MPRKPKSDATHAAQPRAATKRRARTRPATTPAAPTADGGEYLMLPVWQIQPAPWQPRRLFERIEELAATIAGSTETEGVGVLEPVLVRRLEDGTYQLIDGERRVRACRMLAERSPARDFLVPARVFVVSERIARLMSQTANLERDEPRAFEVALGYQGIREALRDEMGDAATSARSIAGLGPHQKTQVARLLRIADALTPHVLATAGLIDAKGGPDVARLACMSVKDLHDAAKLDDPDARAAALKARAERSSKSAASRAARTTSPTIATPDERRAQITTEVGFAVRMRTPAQMMAPTEAEQIVRTELAPAILALVERAHGGAHRDGFYGSVAADHVLLVLPHEIEALTIEQLERLMRDLAEIRGRANRAMRLRRRRSPHASAA